MSGRLSSPVGNYYQFVVVEDDDDDSLPPISAVDDELESSEM